MGQDALANIGFGVELENHIHDAAGLPQEVKDLLAEKMGLEDSRSWRGRTPEQEEIYSAFEERWESIGIDTIQGGTHGHSDTVFVAEETKESAWWNAPEGLGTQLARPSIAEFRDRLEAFLDLAHEIHDEIEVEGSPQWHIVAFFG